MKVILRSVSVLILLNFAGCVSLPQGPSIMTLPGRGQTYEQHKMAVAYCQHEAQVATKESPEAVAAKSTATTALIGGLLGAAAGAAIGAGTGNAGAGAAIGGGSGLAVGAVGGAGAGQRAALALQQRFDQAYAACIFAMGGQIPSIPVMSR